MRIDFSYSSAYSLTQRNFLPSLSDSNKRILAVALGILSLIALYYTFFSFKSKNTSHEDWAYVDYEGSRRPTAKRKLDFSDEALNK